MTLVPFSLQTAALKPGDIAERLAVEPSTVYRWIRSGELPAFELVGTKYVLVSAYERFLERRDKGVTIEEQAERYIGAGFEEEHADAFDPLEALELPIRVGSATAVDATAGTIVEPVLENVRTRLKDQLDAFERQYHFASERVHRLSFVEHQPHVEGIPDEVVSEWGRTYAAYLSLSLVATH